MKKIMFIYVFICLLFAIPLFADNVYKDANELVYDQTEVVFVRDMLKNIESNNLKNILEFTVNFKIDLKFHKNKLYTAVIIQNLLEKINAMDIILKNDACIKFISSYENSLDFDDDYTWNKIVVWMLLRPGIKEINNYNAIEFYQISLRRQKILNSIIDNNSSCAPLALYLLIVTGGLEIGINAPEDVLSQKIAALQMIIDKYPSSEFAAGAMINIMGCYTSCNKIDNAIQTCQLVNKKYNNFHIGLNDLYSEMYLDLVNKYIELRDIKHAEYFFKFINVNIIDYDIVKHQFLTDIESIKDNQMR